MQLTVRAMEMRPLNDVGVGRDFSKLSIALARR